MHDLQSSDVQPLTDDESAALDRLLQYERLRARFELDRLWALSRLRLRDVMATSLDPRRPADARRLATLAEWTAPAYARLERVDAALRLVDRVVDASHRQLGAGAAE